MFAAPGLDFIRGEARFTGERTVTIALQDGGERTIRGERVLINLGSRPARPAIPGLWESGAWTNEEILRLEELPSSLAIIGASYIGVEFASMMATFGVDVTLISSGDHVLPREDEDAARVVEAGLEAAGVRIVPGRAESASREGNTTTLTLSDGSTVSAEAVLVAVGRVPNTDGIGLDEAGIELTDRGFVAVDEHLRTSAEGVWAAGDCAGTPMFTHASWSDFRIIRAQLTGASLDDATTTTKGRTIPYAVFATPELARIGLSEGEAREAGLDVRIAKVPDGRDSARQDDALRGRGLLEGRRRREHAPDPGRHADRPERLRGHHGRARRHGRRPGLRAAALPADRAPDHGRGPAGPLRLPGLRAYRAPWVPLGARPGAPPGTREEQTGRVRTITRSDPPLLYSVALGTRCARHPALSAGFEAGASQPRPHPLLAQPSQAPEDAKW